MRFERVDLALFIHVAESGSITGGAQRSHLALASASERIKNMEARAGAPLLTRLPRGAALTPAGEILLRHAKIICGAHARLGEELSAFVAGYGGVLRLNANTSGAAWLSSRIAPWLAAHPGLLLEVEEKPSAETVCDVAQGRVEAGLISDAVGTEELITEPLAWDNLVIVAARGHALARKTSADLREVVGEPFIGLEAGSALQQYISARAGDVNHALMYRFRSRNIEGVCEMAGRGIGIAVVPEVQARLYKLRFELSIVLLSNAWARRSICLCYRNWAALSPTVRTLIDEIRARAGKVEQ